MSGPTNHPTPDDDTLRRLGVRYVVERGEDGALAPRALGGEPAPSPGGAALSLPSLPECSDCAGRQEELGRICSEQADLPGQRVVFRNPAGGYCYCRCP